MFLKIEFDEESEIYSFKGRKVITIGRGPENDIQLLVDGLSRCHVKLYYNGGNYYVEDQNSTNGTFINEERLSPNEKYPLNTFFPVRIGFDVNLYLLDALTVDEQGEIHVIENDEDEQDELSAVLTEYANENKGEIGSKNAYVDLEVDSSEESKIISSEEEFSEIMDDGLPSQEARTRIIGIEEQNSLKKKKKKKKKAKRKSAGFLDMKSDVPKRIKHKGMSKAVSKKARGKKKLSEEDIKFRKQSIGLVAGFLLVYYMYSYFFGAEEQVNPPVEQVVAVERKKIEDQRKQEEEKRKQAILKQFELGKTVMKEQWEKAGLGIGNQKCLGPSEAPICDELKKFPENTELSFYDGAYVSFNSVYIFVDLDKFEPEFVKRCVLSEAEKNLLLKKLSATVSQEELKEFTARGFKFPGEPTPEEKGIAIILFSTFKSTITEKVSADKSLENIIFVGFRMEGTRAKVISVIPMSKEQAVLSLAGVRQMSKSAYAVNRFTELNKFLVESASTFKNKSN